MNCQKSLDLAYKIRLHALEMTSRGGTSHIASIFSMADLVAVLYADVLRFDPKNPRMPDRDRLILSKGHLRGAGRERLFPRGGAAHPLSERQPPERARQPQGRARRGGVHRLAGAGPAHGHGHGIGREA